MTTEISRVALLLRHGVKQGAKYIVFCVADQDKARVIGVGVQVSGGIQLIKVVSVLRCLEDELWNPNSDVCGHHHPEVGVRLVLDNG